MSFVKRDPSARTIAEKRFFLSNNSSPTFTQPRSIRAPNGTLGKSRLSIKSVKTIEQLAYYLKQQSNGHALAFEDLSAIRAAINHQFVANDAEVTDRDEVAFFPPVTGG